MTARGDVIPICMFIGVLDVDDEPSSSLSWGANPPQLSLLSRRTARHNRLFGYYSGNRG